MALFSDNQTPVIKSLRRRWAGFALLSAFILAGGYAILRSFWEPAYAGRWAIQTGILLAYLLVVLWRGLPYNTRLSESQLLPDLGAGNCMTLLRGVLIAGLAGFLFSPPPQGWLAWLPGLCYSLAVIADYLDGYLARRTNRATRLGEILDMSFDGMGVLAASLLAIQYGRLPIWYMAVGFARYAFLAGLWLRRRLDKPTYDLPPSLPRRVLAGFQMGFIAVMLWPLFSPPGTYYAAIFFGLPFLVNFMVDWLYASGGLSLSARPTASLRRVASHWLPVALRLVILALAASPLLQAALAYRSQGEPLPALLLLESLVVLLLLFGVAGRAIAVAGLLLLGVYQMSANLALNQVLLGAALTAILFFGTGALSLWRPEDRLIYRRTGEANSARGNP